MDIIGQKVWGTLTKFTNVFACKAVLKKKCQLSYFLRNSFVALLLCFHCVDNSDE